MENVELKYKELCKLNTLTWIEYNLEYFAKEILERATSIVQPKETVSDFDKAAWFTSLTVLLGKILPANRFLFRIMEDESKFFIQFHDTAQIQQPQTIEVPYRKVFDWGVESWDDALQLCKKDRRELYSKWTNEGYNDSQIARHFGIKGSNSIRSWANRDSWNSALRKTRKRFSETTVGPVIARIRYILKANGVDTIIRNVFKDVYHQITGDTITCNSLISTNIKTLSPDIPKCLNIAIRYTEEVIEKIKEVNSSPLTSRSIGQFVSGLSRSSKIKNAPKKAYDPITGKTRSVINYNELEKILDFYTNVITNLNKMKGELK